MNRYKFADLIKIEKKENYTFHFPYLAYVERLNGEKHLTALCLKKIEDVYEVINAYLKTGVSTLHFSIDLKRIEGLIDYDFVVVYTFENNKWMCLILPYDKYGNKIGLRMLDQLENILLSQVISFCTAHLN